MKSTELGVLDGRSSQNDNSIQCRLDHRLEMPLGELCGIDISIDQIGDAMITSKVDICITIEAAVKSLEPKSGSIYGGQIITVKGEGLNTATDLYGYKVRYKFFAKFFPLTKALTIQIQCTEWQKHRKPTLDKRKFELSIFNLFSFNPLALKIIKIPSLKQSQINSQ